MSVERQETEAELEAFRQQWRNEVSARNKTAPKVKTKTDSLNDGVGSSRASELRQVPSKHQKLPDDIDDIEYSQTYDGHADESLINQTESVHITPVKTDSTEPKSALEHYEHAVERESSGQHGDSINHYRRAYKLDDGVHEAYKKKHFPAVPVPKAKSAEKPVADHDQTAPTDAPIVPLTLKELIQSFSLTQIEPPPPETDLSPETRCLLGELPEEILVNILTQAALIDVAFVARLALVCKRLAYLVMTEEQIWKGIALSSLSGFTGIPHDFSCDVEGRPFNTLDSYLDVAIDSNTERPVASPLELRQLKISYARELLTSTYSSSWRTMFRSRPRMRFGGCYISTVNYTRPGAAGANTLLYSVPVHVVTYYRYLRFFRDGSVISLLTTHEPNDVIHQLTKANTNSRQHEDRVVRNSGTRDAATRDQAVMKDALLGRWRLSSPISSSKDPLTGEDEPEGELHIETSGVLPKYTYRMHLSLTSAGKGARNNKLAWKGYWSYNRLTDDWAEFYLRNDRPFYWSRVKSYGLGKE